MIQTGASAAIESPESENAPLLSQAGPENTSIDRRNPGRSSNSGRMSKALGGCPGNLVEDDLMSPKCNNVNAVYNVITTCIGGGIFSLVYAMGKGGWVGGVGSLIAATLISLFTCLLMTYVCDEIEKKKPKVSLCTIDDVAEQLMGPWAKIPCAIIVVLDLLAGIAGGVAIGQDCLVNVVKNILDSKMIPQIVLNSFPNIGYEKPCLIMIVAVLLPISCLKSMTELGKVSIFGIVAIFFTFGVMLFGYIGACTLDTPGLQSPLFISQIGASFSLFTFSYAVTCIVPCMRKDMQKPKDLPRVLTVSHAVVFLLYAVLAVVGYLALGEKADDNFFNWKFEFLPDSWQRFPVIIICILNIVNLSISLPLYVNPVGQMIEAQVTSYFNASEPIIRYTTRTCLMAVGVSYFLLVPFFQEICSLQGATTNLIVNCILPFICAFIVIWVKDGGTGGRWFPEKMQFSTVMLLFGCIVAVTLLVGAGWKGVVDALESLEKKLAEAVQAKQLAKAVQAKHS